MLLGINAVGCLLFRLQSSRLLPRKKSNTQKILKLRLHLSLTMQMSAAASVGRGVRLGCYVCPFRCPIFASPPPKEVRANHRWVAGWPRHRLGIASNILVPQLVHRWVAGWPRHGLGISSNILVPCFLAHREDDDVGRCSCRRWRGGTSRSKPITRPSHQCGRPAQRGRRGRRVRCVQRGRRAPVALSCMTPEFTVLS